MKRRHLLALCLGSAAVLTVGGTAWMAWRPAIVQGRLAEPGRRVLHALARGVLDGQLPGGAHQEAALQDLLERIDDLVRVLPAPVTGELGQLLSLLAGAPGRLALAGLRRDWADADVVELQQALQGMRLSRIDLRQQAYHALRDIICGSYFAAPRTWPSMGYPGPLEV